MVLTKYLTDIVDQYYGRPLLLLANNVDMVVLVCTHAVHMRLHIRTTSPLHTHIPNIPTTHPTPTQYTPYALLTRHMHCECCKVTLHARCNVKTPRSGVHSCEVLYRRDVFKLYLSLVVPPLVINGLPQQLYSSLCEKVVCVCVCVCFLCVCVFVFVLGFHRIALHTLSLPLFPLTTLLAPHC